jgi:hypothetical protein
MVSSAWAEVAGAMDVAQSARIRVAFIRTVVRIFMIIPSFLIGRSGLAVPP